MSYISEKLKTVRLAKGWTQHDLSQKLNIPQSHLSKIESGKTDLRLESLKLIAEHLDLEVMLVPKILSSQVTALINGEDLSQPLWSIDEEPSRE